MFRGRGEKEEEQEGEALPPQEVLVASEQGP